MELLINEPGNARRNNDLVKILKSHSLKNCDSFVNDQDLVVSEMHIEPKLEQDETKIIIDLIKLELKDTIRDMKAQEVFTLFQTSPERFNEEVIVSLSDEQVAYLSDRERLKVISEKNKELMHWVKRTLPLKSTANLKKALLALKLLKLKGLIVSELDKPKTQKTVLSMVCENSMDWGNDAPKWADGVKTFFNESEGLRTRVINIFRINKLKNHILEDGIITTPDDFIRKMIFLPNDLHKQEELNPVAIEICKVVNSAIRTPIGLFEELK